MKDINGFELCSRLKDNNNTSHIPILLLTAKSDSKSKLEGLSVGADDYVTKPFNMAELLLRINNHLKKQIKFKEYISQNTNTQTNIVSGTPVKADSFIESLNKIIENNLSNTMFGVDELVHATSLSRTSLHRKLKRQTGMSTSEFIRSYRLKKAAELLQENLHISKVAAITGFASSAYFTKCFRETL